MRIHLRCLGCGAAWEGGGDWQVYFTCDQPPQPLAYCPGCTPREPGYARSTTKQRRGSRGNGERRTETTR
jgi:hypothetical protein